MPPFETQPTSGRYSTRAPHADGNAPLCQGFASQRLSPSPSEGQSQHQLSSEIVNGEDAGQKQTSRSRLENDIAAGPARALADLAIAVREFDDAGESAELVPHASSEGEKSIDAHQARGYANPKGPGAIAMLMKNAEILIQAGESRLATNILRAVLTHSPEHSKALRAMGFCLRNQGRLEEALKCFRALVKICRDQETLLLLGETLYLCERDDEALNVYQELLRDIVKDEDALFDIYKNVGNIHVRARDFDAAEEFYDKAHALQRDSDVLMVNYGTLELQRENLAGAVERFRSAVELNPENDKGWVGLAMVHRMMGDWELACANLEKALDINKNNRTAIQLFADWGVRDGKYQLAAARLKDYVSSGGAEDVEMCFSLAKILVQIGQLREARIELERVLALEPALDGADALARVLDREIARREAASSGRQSDHGVESGLESL